MWIWIILGNLTSHTVSYYDDANFCWFASWMQVLTNYYCTNYFLFQIHATQTINQIIIHQTKLLFSTLILLKKSMCVIRINFFSCLLVLLNTSMIKCLNWILDFHHTRIVEILNSNINSMKQYLIHLE